MSGVADLLQGGLRWPVEARMCPRAVSSASVSTGYGNETRGGQMQITGSVAFRSTRVVVVSLCLSLACHAPAHAQAFKAFEGCKTVPWPAPPRVDPKSLKEFDSCDKEGPPKYNNYCCSGLPDCPPGD